MLGSSKRKREGFIWQGRGGAGIVCSSCRRVMWALARLLLLLLLLLRCARSLHEMMMMMMPPLNLLLVK